MELYKLLRPKKLKDIKGQERAKRIVRGWINRQQFPYAVLLSGPTGVGKTSFAHVLRRLLKISVTDYDEINAASDRGIDIIRDIESKSGFGGMNGEYRMVVLDECGQLSKDAMVALLKVLENDKQTWVYYVLCTTDDDKLLPTLKNRCARLYLELLEEEHILEILQRAQEHMSVKLHKKVIKQLVEAAEGSGRTALQIFESVIGIDGVSEQLECITKQSPKALAIEIARAITKPKASWKDVSKLLRDVKDDPEKIRRSILGYASAMLLNGMNNPKLHYILIEFESNLYDSGMSGLVRAAYEVCQK